MPRQLISSGGTWEDRVGYSRAVRLGDRVWVSGCTGVEPDGTIAEEPARQATRALEIIASALAQAGASLSDVVMARIYLVDFADFEGVTPVLREHFDAIRPAMVAVQVAALIDPRMRVEIEAEAVVEGD